MWSDGKPGYCLDNLNAYTVAELGAMLPKWFSSHLDVKKGDGDEGLGDVWVCSPPRQMVEDGIEFQAASTEADARAKMLIYLIESDLVQLDYFGEIPSTFHSTFRAALP